MPTQFTAKRFKFASREDLALWEQESSDEEGVIFAGPIAGVVPIREILEKSGEDGLIHPATSDRDEQIRQATDSNGLFYSSEKTINYYDYQENFTPAGPCGHHECGVCYGSLIRFDKPKILIPGYAENAPEVVTARFKYAKKQKLRYLVKLAKLVEISTALSKMTDIMDEADAIDSPNLDNYYNSSQ